MIFDMTQDNQEPCYQVHLYGWNVDDKYLFSDYTSARYMYDDLVEQYRTFTLDKPIITISDVIASERIQHNEDIKKRKNLYVSTQKLYRDLATVIRGDITTHIVNNMLIVDIIAYGIPWRYTTTDLKTDHTIDIITQYQDHIFNLFFDKEFDLMV